MLSSVKDQEKSYNPKKELYSLEERSSQTQWGRSLIGLLLITSLYILFFTYEPLSAALRIYPLVLVGFFVAFLWKQRAQLIPGIPCPPSSVYFGHLGGIWKNYERLHDWHLEDSEKYGPGAWQVTLPFRDGGSSLFLPLDVKVSQYVHETNWLNYQKGHLIVEVLEEFIGGGIFAVNGKEWKDQRGIASHMFSTRAIKEDMMPVFYKHGQTVLRLLEQQVAKGGSMDIQDIFFRYTVTAFSEIGFGEDLSALTRDPSEVPFIASFDQAQALMPHRMSVPFWKVQRFLQKMFPFLPICARERTIAHAMKLMDEYAKSVFEKRKEDVKSGGDAGKDLISRFLQEAKTPPSDKFLRDVVLNFLIAGRDTTACALTWLIYLLCTHPEAEAKVVAEARSALAENPDPHNAANSMPYLDACLKETLRLYPSVPFEFKTAVADDTLPDGTFVPAGTQVVYAPYVWGRSTHLWGVDANQFKPERWLSGDKHGEYKYVTFNAGRRICLGKHVALLEGKLLAAMILSRYKLKLVPDRPVTYLTTITMPVKDGLHITVEPREF